MGARTFSVSSYREARVSRGVVEDEHVTRVAEQTARETGKLKPTVDPSVDVIRRSLLRFNQTDDGYTVTIGCPMNVEESTDTTGSMGGNVDVNMGVLPDTYDLLSQVLPGYDLQLALGIFGDVCDRFPLQRPQFEMTAETIVEYLTDFVPERKGGDTPEDPQYSMFAAAYLTDAYTNRIGLKGYYFVTSDAPIHNRISEDQLIRIFGKDVFKKLTENGNQIDKNSLPTPSEVAHALKKRMHTFFLQVGRQNDATECWIRLFGADRVIHLPDVHYKPHVQAVIVGLTEGILQLSEVEDFLVKNNLTESMARKITQSVSCIPLGEQAKLLEKLEHPLPKPGDVFASKTDLWPVSYAEDIPEEKKEDEGPEGWL
ncbi:hypothetical protein FACS189431_8180 [Alphaproteobacteria bacterium]|nr:hypothetical protein FACS189431_8180 [Alphaproteobacteria bacterium]